MKIKLIIILIVFSSWGLTAQDATTTLEGKVTFVTSNNVYVRFDSTDAIPIGAKLLFDGSECLEVTEKSSTSVVCIVINDCIITNGASTTYKTTISEEPTSEKIEDNVDETIPAEVVIPKEIDIKKESQYKENIRGRVAAASYNTFSKLRDDRHRLQFRFSLNANHINDGKFSVESYITYRSILSAPEDYSGRTSIFNIYNLNSTYDATPTLSINVGRRINPKASTFGANDGLQIEKYFGSFYVGGVVGFRPDFYDYGFNSDLLQYGGYAGFETTASDFYSTTTLGAMEQTNNGATDRRYLFFQHSSTIARNFNLFGSMEMDIFGGDTGGSRLTNLYLSARYRISKAANVMVSYDSRKQIVYYETFQSNIDMILDDDLARQGIRARVNVRPAKILWAGISYSSRFRSDNQNKSDNVYGYATLTKIPGIGGRLNVSYNVNSSNYLTSNIVSVRHSRELFKNKLTGEIYFRSAAYDYKNQETKYDQNYYGLVLGYRITRTWQLSFSGELSQLDDDNTLRFYTILTKRF